MESAVEIGKLFNRCQTCVYWQQVVLHGDVGEGQCRFNAPGAYKVEVKRLIDAKSGLYSLKTIEVPFPPMPYLGWCGDYKCNSELYRKLVVQELERQNHMAIKEEQRAIHTELMGHGLTHGDAETILGLPSFDPAALSAWLKAHGPAAVRLLNLLLPLLVSDPTMLALLKQIIAQWQQSQ